MKSHTMRTRDSDLPPQFADAVSLKDDGVETWLYCVATQRSCFGIPEVGNLEVIAE